MPQKKGNSSSTGGIDTLNPDFVVECIAVAMVRRGFFDTLAVHLKYAYLSDEPLKHLWQWLSRTAARTGNIPTLGQAAQHFNGKDAVLDVIDRVRDVDVDGDRALTNEDALLDGFETYVKRMKFLEANDRITALYNEGNREGAWDAFVRYAGEFSRFTVRTAAYETVFRDFEARQARRVSTDWNKRFRVPTGIDELDWRLGGESGGPESGECVLWLGESGMGKSQVLVSVGIAAARQGHRVAHFQLEGTREQCMNRYDAAWTGTLYADMKTGAVPPDKLAVIRRIAPRLSRHDIVVSSEETFNAKTLVDVRREINEMEKEGGKIDVIIIDYLELLEVGDGHAYTPAEERFRQAKLAKGMKALAMEFNAVVHTATQASNIPEECKNDPEFVITRNHLSEDKGKIRPVDIFVTLNQTRDEQAAEVMRLHTDKLRDYRNGVPIRIANNFSRARFYDRRRTMEMLEEEQ